MEYSKFNLLSALGLTIEIYQTKIYTYLSSFSKPPSNFYKIMYHLCRFFFQNHVLCKFICGGSSQIRSCSVVIDRGRGTRKLLGVIEMFFFFFLIVVVVSWVFISVKTRWIAYFKWVQCIVHKLYLHKAKTHTRRKRKYYLDIDTKELLLLFYIWECIVVIWIFWKVLIF